MCSIDKLKEAHKKSNSTHSICKWSNENSEHINCLYWTNVLELEIHILIFIRPLRECNFQLHLAVSRYLIALYFSLDHCNFSRWLYVHLFDLLHLQINSPDLFNYFSDRFFTFQKTLSELSRMTLNQVHEQYNTIIKGIGGATSCESI